MLSLLCIIHKPSLVVNFVLVLKCVYVFIMIATKTKLVNVIVNTP